MKVHHAELQANCKDLQSKIPHTHFQQFHPFNASMFAPAVVSPHVQCPHFSYGYRPVPTKLFRIHQNFDMNNNNNKKEEFKFKYQRQKENGMFKFWLRLILLNVQLFICGLVIGGEEEEEKELNPSVRHFKIIKMFPFEELEIVNWGLNFKYCRVLIKWSRIR